MRDAIMAGTLRNLFFAATVLAASGAVGQVEIQSHEVGINGCVRPGAWTPLLLTLRNRSAKPLAVICQWVLSDNDGDEPHFRRRLTLTPGVDQGVWLYAAIPADTNLGTNWRLAVLAVQDDRPGKLLASRIIQPGSMSAKIVKSQRVVGLTGTKMLRLDAYESRDLQHEATVFVRGVELGRLPDKWFGLSMLQTLIWTSDGDSPDAAQIRLGTQQAIRQWIYRGGHLVIVMPGLGDPWSNSFLGEAFPPVKVGTLRDQTDLPDWISVSSPIGYRANFRRFELVATARESEVSVLFRDDTGQHPLVVAGQYGFGRVTLIGVDITDRRLARRGYPNPEHPLGDGFWGRILGWRSPALGRAEIARLKKENRFSELYMRQDVDLGKFLSSQISMKQTAAPALMLAIAVFGLYWLAAGPIGFMVLKAKHLTQFSWLLFGAVVLGFSLISWGGAALIRPRHNQIEHFSVMDAVAGSNQVHVRSWAALFMPRHRPVELVVGLAGTAKHANTVASVGLSSGTDEGRFLDSQGYDVAASAPYKMALPMRATTRQLELDYLGPITDPKSSSTEPWVLPNGDVRLIGKMLAAELTHDMPGELEQVLCLYCPGNGEVPRIWTKPHWPARVILHLSDKPRPSGQPPTPLVLPPVFMASDLARDRLWRGYLGDLAFGKPSRVLRRVAGHTGLSAQTLAAHAQMLSLFDALPPPDFQNTRGVMGMGGGSTVSYQRSQGRKIDLSHLTALRRLIIIALLRDAPIPIPLTVDGGKSVSSRGWVVVRWICPVE